jgi:predicted amidohydrolase
MRIGIVQFHPVFGAVARNIAKAISMVRDKDADIWVLPELFATGYQFRDRIETMALSEKLTGPTLTTMAEKAAAFNCWFCGGFAERDGKRVYNSAFLIGPEGDLFVYRKVHLFDREKLYFDPGNQGFGVVPVRGVNVGLMVCFDWLFPESARTLALKGADVILHPSNLVLPHCPEAMKTRALENGVFTVTANRIGTEERLAGQPLTYIGQSVVYSPKGERLLQLGGEEEEAVVVEIQAESARDKQITEGNHLLLDRIAKQYKVE